MAQNTAYDSILNWLYSQWYVAVTVILVLIISSLPQVRDGLNIIVSPFRRKKKSFTEFNGPGEIARYEEKMRSREHDVVKIHCHSHIVGVMAEYAWIQHMFPRIGKDRRQSIVKLDMILNDSDVEEIWFDILEFTLPNGQKKQVYFDITDFFSSSGTSLTNPSEFMAEKLRRMYKQVKST